MNTIQLALKGNHFDSLLFVYKECNDWSSETILLYDNVFCNEHIEAWLHDVGDGPEFDYM
ncbi:hypothetical protein GN244_ATG20245 [Phytophthora infestans]|uniref:Uncharacterized protein n=1 Tax=Phytophthora infestans TaxID=4787 RepID=A0A833SDH4_PHYIN|nr:hypothetical protein GN244_ATG20245 [Phytophthora infestans]